MEGIFFLLVLGLVLTSPFWIIPVLTFLFTGRTFTQQAARHEEKKLDRQMAVAAQRHRAQVAAAQRFNAKHGTDWLNGR